MKQNQQNPANSDDIIFGKNTIIEALSNNCRKLNKIIIQKGLHRDQKIDHILDLAKEKKILFEFYNKEYFNKFNTLSHQGVLAFVSPIEYLDLHSFLDIQFDKIKQNQSKIIILDGVTDPHNLGAIIRTSACAGFDAIIISDHRNAKLSSIVEKTSAGAVNHIPIIKVNSLSYAIDTLKNNHYWIIATDIKANNNYFEIDFTDMNFALILGSEGKGATKTMLNKSDFKIKIPIFNKFDSLNVSNAASIVIYEAVRQICIKNQ